MKQEKSGHWLVETIIWFICFFTLRQFFDNGIGLLILSSVISLAIAGIISAIIGNGRQPVEPVGKTPRENIEIEKSPSETAAKVELPTKVVDEKQPVSGMPITPSIQTPVRHQSNKKTHSPLRRIVGVISAIIGGGSFLLWLSMFLLIGEPDFGEIMLATSLCLFLPALIFFMVAWLLLRNKTPALSHPLKSPLNS